MGFRCKMQKWENIDVLWAAGRSWLTSLARQMWSCLEEGSTTAFVISTPRPTTMTKERGLLSLISPCRNLVSVGMQYVWLGPPGLIRVREPELAISLHVTKL